MKTNVSYAGAQEPFPPPPPPPPPPFFFFFFFSVTRASYSIIYKTRHKVPSFVTFLLFVFFSPLNCRLIWSLFYTFYCRSSNTPGGGGGGGEGRGILGLILTGYVHLASQNTYPIIVYSVANYIPLLSHV